MLWVGGPAGLCSGTRESSVVSLTALLNSHEFSDTSLDDPGYTECAICLLLRTTNSFFLRVPRRFFRCQCATPLGSGNCVSLRSRFLNPHGKKISLEQTMNAALLCCPILTSVASVSLCLCGSFRWFVNDELNHRDELN